MNNMLNDIAKHIEFVLRLENKSITWNSEIKRFVIYDNTEKDYIYHKTSILNCILNPIEFFKKYADIIRISPYYDKYMAKILGQD